MWVEVDVLESEDEPGRTAQAASGNHESVVIFRGAGEPTASFTAQFERMWSLFAPAAASG